MNNSFITFTTLRGLLAVKYVKYCTLCRGSQTLRNTFRLLMSTNFGNPITLKCVCNNCAFDRVYISIILVLSNSKNVWLGLVQKRPIIKWPNCKVELSRHSFVVVVPTYYTTMDHGLYGRSFFGAAEEFPLQWGNEPIPNAIMSFISAFKGRRQIPKS